MQIDTALIYAAGFGTRMGHLTKTCPKPLLPFGEQSLIDHVMTPLRASGITQFHVNAHYHADQLLAHFASAGDVTLHYEPEAPYDTGGTLKALAELLPETILTANSDVLFSKGDPLLQLRQNWVDDMDALLLLIPRENALGFEGQGDFYLESALSWRGGRAFAPFIYSGMQIIRPKVAVQIADQRFSNTQIFDSLMKKGRIGAVIFDGKWRDIGTEQAYRAAQAEMGRAP